MSTSRPHRRLTITQPSGRKLLPEPPGGGAAESALADRLAEWERRLARLEAEVGPGARAEGAGAPFRVADREGRVLLEIDADEEGTWFRLFNAAGQPVAILFADAEGGGLTLTDAGGRPLARLPEGGAPEEGAGDETVAAEGEATGVADFAAGAASLAPYGREGRRAAGVYAEGARGAVRVYDEEGSCLYAHG